MYSTGLSISGALLATRLCTPPTQRRLPDNHRLFCYREFLIAILIEWPNTNFSWLCPSFITRLWKRNEHLHSAEAFKSLTQHFLCYWARHVIGISKEGNSFFFFLTRFPFLNKTCSIRLCVTLEAIWKELNRRIVSLHVHQIIKLCIGLPYQISVRQSNSKQELLSVLTAN